MTDLLCTVEHRKEPDRARLAMDGLTVCQGCAARVFDQLTDLSRLYEELGEAMVGTWRETTTDAVWALTIPEKPLPFHPDVADHRTEIGSVLASLARMVAEDLDGGWPPTGTDRVVSWLLERLPFVLAQDWAPVIVDQVGALTRTANAFLDPRRVRRLPCGPCRAVAIGPAVDGNHPFLCAGTLIARIGDHDEDRADPTCDRCGVVVTIDHAAALRRGMAELLTAQDAAVVVGVPASTVRRWVAAGKLRRQGVDAGGRALLMLEHVRVLVAARPVKSTGETTCA